MDMLISPSRVLPKDVIAMDVSEEDYLDDYAEQHCEYVDGMVIKMSPVRMEHDKYFKFFIVLFETYLELHPIGTLRVEPFVMELSPAIKREPDLMIILDTNPGKLTDTIMRGAADLCVEIVSLGSVERDYHDKYLEYQQFGVREYWLLDYRRREMRFHQLNDKGEYVIVEADAEGNYRSLVLPGLVIHVPTLWQERLPGPIALAKLLQSGMKSDTEDKE